MTLSSLLADLRRQDIRLWVEGDRLQCSAPTGVLTPELCNQLQQRKSELLEYLRGPAELSFSQQRLWFLDQIAPGGRAYVIAGALELSGTLDARLLEQALRALVNRHESLRTVFTSVEGQPRQVVSAPGEWVLPFADVSMEQQPRERLREILREEAVRGFDLARSPLFRANLYRLATDTYVLLLTMHHIISDGWSVGILFRELGEFYGCLARGEPISVPALRLQYRDFARWQRNWLQGEVLEKMLGHWRSRLAAAPQVLELPTDRPRPVVESFRGAACSFALSLELSKGLRLLSQRTGGTLFITLLSGFALLLARYSGQQDLLIGSPVANRNRAEIETLVGFFVNTLILRADLSGAPPVKEFLVRIRDVCLDAYAHQDLPLERLVEELRPERDVSRNPVFQVIFVLQNAPQDALELPGLKLRPVAMEHGAAQVDLTLMMKDTPAGLVGSVVYATDLFNESTILRMTAHYRVLLEALVAGPERSIADLPLLGEAERQQLLEWNRTERSYPRESAIHALFAEQVLRTPEAVAVECGQLRLSYRELNERANRVARYLVRHGVGAEVMVGLCVERSVEMVVGVLGILKAGGAYVPLDPEYPGARLRFMLEDTAAPVLLTQEKLRARLPAYEGRVIALDTQWAEIAQERAEDLPVTTGGRKLAYVIYTSGSTGRPKGTCIEHRSVVRLVKNTNYIVLGADDVVLQFAPVSFDASTLELWGSLLNGAKLAVCPPGVLSLPELGEFIQARGVTTLWLTAALFHQMVDSQLESLRGVRQLLAGGDTLSVAHVRRMLEVIGSGRLINGYGPTENTTFTCCHVMTAESRLEQTVPIGRPISNTRVYVLDRQRQPVPVGVYGELYIGGDGLAREYLNQPQLTAEKFIADPFSTVEGERLYRTGDLVRYREDGVIEFLGRMDNQVKVRGFRIELGEVEAALRQQAQVSEAVVVVREDAPGDKRLVAYVVAADGATDDLVEQLRGQLRASLPDYMVPSAFVQLAQLPLTPNGKVDRKALPAPERENQVTAAYAAPGNELEQQLAAVWQAVLRLEQVGVDDNFFDLGGNSLLVTRVHARIKPLFAREVRVVDLFRYPTIRLLAGALAEDSNTTSASQNLIQARARKRRDAFISRQAASGS